MRTSGKPAPLRAPSPGAGQGEGIAMDIRIRRGGRADVLEAILPGRPPVRFETPNKGPVPHDAVHVFVERAFRLEKGFWGLIATGLSPDDLQALAATGGHPSAARASVPDAGIVQLLQSERLVEVFEADLWSGGQGKAEDLLALAEVACASSGVDLPPAPAGAVAAVQADLQGFARAWADVPRGGEARLEWPG